MEDQRYEIARKLIEPLLAYYDANKRVLPWREDPSAYKVWISEIMLQQTRVLAVKPYFHRFIEALPSIQALAEVEQEVLLKLWEGLGYYNRARNLQKAAKIVVEEYDGVMPDALEQLLSLPGIGPYTAGAVASIAYQVKTPAVDGNVLRVMSRIFEDGRDILSQKVKKDWEQVLLATMSEKRPGDYNQALMEIGAMVCVPNGAPKCELCPFQKLCGAHAKGTWTQYPYKEPKKKRVIEERTVLVLRDAENMVLTKRPDTGLLAGLYEFPCIEGHLSSEEVLAYLKQLGLETVWISELIKAKHIFTHKEWHMIGYMVRMDELSDVKINQAQAKWKLVEPTETKTKYPIPTAYASYMKYLDITVGYERFDEKGNGVDGE
ncbi:MAG: A/G-specific adenine glycosylase [Lachnospiraceae bacterium]